MTKVISEKANQYNYRRSRRARGAIYTACLASLMIPFVLALGDAVLQAALSFYNQGRLNFVAHDVIEHFQSLDQLDSSNFEKLFLKLSAVNSLNLKNIKSTITTVEADADGDQAVQIILSGTCQNALGLFSWDRPFKTTYNIKLSKFETMAYSAINVYPYCEAEPMRGLSLYIPLNRAAAASPIWAFNQDRAIGSVRQSACPLNAIDASKPNNWHPVADGILSIY